VSPRRRELAACAVWALLFGAAPTVGDVGSCSEQAAPLDEATFAAQRKALDCQKCQQCGFTTKTCTSACNPDAPPSVGWPNTCYPLQHDGTVCLDALEVASCGAYASYVSDTGPTVPTECDFCHLPADASSTPGEL
jgi:hypothetical protein